MYTSEIENKAIEQREKILENKRMPEIDDIETWITNRINILKLPGTEVEDPGLLDSVELHFHRLNGYYSLNFCHVLGILKPWN